ncbi:MAG: hypothetical protein HC913_13635 [Microscillaceae bacterium]|nr:hypothetical protein [Microscillaceae bacterium]
MKKQLVFYFAIGLSLTCLWAQEKPGNTFSSAPMATQKLPYLRHFPPYKNRSPKPLHSIGFIKDEGYTRLVRTAYENICFHFDHIPFRYAYALLTAPPSYLPLSQASAQPLRLLPSPGFQTYFLRPTLEEYRQK